MEDKLLKNIVEVAKANRSKYDEGPFRINIEPLLAYRTRDAIRARVASLFKGQGIVVMAPKTSQVRVSSRESLFIVLLLIGILSQIIVESLQVWFICGIV